MYYIDPEEGLIDGWRASFYIPLGNVVMFLGFHPTDSYYSKVLWEDKPYFIQTFRLTDGDLLPPGEDGLRVYETFDQDFKDNTSFRNLLL